LLDGDVLPDFPRAGALLLLRAIMNGLLASVVVVTVGMEVKISGQ
jgi:hypothetical protein